MPVRRWTAGRWHLPTKPELAERTADTSTAPLISVRDLKVHFALRTNSFSRLFGSSSEAVSAVDGVSFDLAPGEVLGLVGESGSGKSTLGRALLGLVRPSAGSITYRGQELIGLSERKLRPFRRKLQMVFQDPHASMNPSMTVGKAIADALRIQGVPAAERGQLVTDSLERVGLAPASRFAPKYPGELSGGQKQRAVIARAISLDPELLVADEPISMLDMSVRAKILGLLEELRRDLGLSYVYITHDLASARFFCDQVAIMYLGKIVEIGPVEEIFDNPRHPYTAALLNAVPDPDPARGVARDLPRGEVPDAVRPPLGCTFHPRCPKAFEPCGWQARDLRMVLEQRWTGVDAAQYAEESALVGDVEQFDEVEAEDEVALLRPRSGAPVDEANLFKTMQDDDPDEPFWKGVREVRPDGDKLRIEFRGRVEPQLQRVPGSGVEVSCHLYHDPEATAALSKSTKADNA
jgi:peptide/nickel transport system ATP-binding protein